MLQSVYRPNAQIKNEGKKRAFQSTGDIQRGLGMVTKQICYCCIEPSSNGISTFPSCILFTLTVQDLIDV